MTLADFDVNFDLKGFNIVFYTLFGLVAIFIVSKFN